MIRFLIVTALSLSAFIPSEVSAKKWRIIVEYAKPADPCRIVAGAKRREKIKTTPETILYNSSKTGAIIAYHHKRKKPTCALIYPAKTLF